MSNKICPKCGKTAEYNEDHNKYICAGCGWESEEAPEFAGFKDFVKNYNCSCKSGKIEDKLKDVLEYVKECEKERDKALKQLSEWNKDEEIQKLKEELEEKKKELYRAFTVSPEEQEKISAWMEKHIAEKHSGNDYAGAIGGRYTYHFCPTGIGDIGEIHCICGDSFCFRELE